MIDVPEQKDTSTTALQIGKPVVYTIEAKDLTGLLEPAFKNLVVAMLSHEGYFYMLLREQGTIIRVKNHELMARLRMDVLSKSKPVNYTLITRLAPKNESVIIFHGKLSIFNKDNQKMMHVLVYLGNKQMETKALGSPSLDIFKFNEPKEFIFKLDF